MEGGTEGFSILPPRQASGSARARVYYQVRGDNGPDWDIPNNDVSTVAQAILERVFFVKDKVNGGFKRAPRPWTHEKFKDMKFRHVRRAVLDELSSVRSRIKKFATRVSPLSNIDFVNSFGGAKRALYIWAIESLEMRPLERRDARVGTFSKAEYLKPGGAPRAIQPRSPRFNVHLGRYIKHVEHEIFQAIDLAFDETGQHRTVAKGMNMIERGNVIEAMWNSFETPVAVGLDAERFDQHIHQLLLEHEHKIYPMFCESHGDGLMDLQKLLKLQLRNHGRFYGKDGIIKYKVDGCRMSGDMNTSLGNVIIMCSLMYSYMEKKNLLKRVKLLNDGDDCVLIMDARTVKAFKSGLQEWFLEMGISMAYDGIYRELEHVEFCQARPVLDETLGYRLTPRPSKRLYSDLVSTKDLSSRKVYRKWLGAVAGCGLAGTSGQPVFQSYYSWLAKGSTPYVPQAGSAYYKFRNDLIQGMSMKRREPTERERISFMHAFDLTPTEQRLLEEYFDGLPDPCYSKPEDIRSRTLDLRQHLCPPEQKENDHLNYDIRNQ